MPNQHSDAITCTIAQPRPGYKLSCTRHASKCMCTRSQITHRQVIYCRSCCWRKGACHFDHAMNTSQSVEDITSISSLSCCGQLLSRAVVPCTSNQAVAALWERPVFSTSIHRTALLWELVRAVCTSDRVAAAFIVAAPHLGLLNIFDKIHLGTVFRFALEAVSEPAGRGSRLLTQSHNPSMANQL